MKFEKEENSELFHRHSCPAEAWKFINIFSSHDFMNQTEKLLGRTGRVREREAEETCVFQVREWRKWRSLTGVRIVAYDDDIDKFYFFSSAVDKNFSTLLEIILYLRFDRPEKVFLNKHCEIVWTFFTRVKFYEALWRESRVVQFFKKNDHARYLPSFSFL